MFNLVNFTPREYQSSILETCKNNNTLVVLPTGTGKTAIALLLGIERLNKFQNSKILVLSPTKPLSQQHVNTFKQHTDLPQDKIILLTGLIKPEQRKELVEDALVIVATPQTIEKDLENSRIGLRDFSLLVIDEAHRSRLNFANTHVTKAYFEQSLNPRILALTASPGGTLDRIKEIMKNLNLEAVEIRSETDKDVKQYIQKREIEWIEVNLQHELLRLHSKIKNIYLNKAKELLRLGFNKPTHLINKKDLIQMQAVLRNNLNKGDKSAYYGISLTAQLIKIDYMMELLEIQGLRVLSKFLDKLKLDESKAAKNILNNKEFQDIIHLTTDLIKNGLEHPKFSKLLEIVKNEINLNKSIKIMVFANYRDTVDNILKLFKENNIKTVKLIGQKSGLTQKQQILTIKTFEENDDNVLIATSIGEEGIDIKGANLVIFYEAVPSEIRKIQRAGRVARLQAGKIIFLITKNTRDEAYFWSGYQKEKRMKTALYNLKDKNIEEFLKDG
ncbi:MAG: Helicase protein [archaeon GW2011_AR20]|nr:MAG: Helicase protein [archaeon GW2011_AR20]MBS3160604.1 DEAD/DEAH box helicase [Candidatus Woesearchaeota archaeon]